MQLFDRVKETTTTTGTGTLTLAGAVSGFRSFSVVGDGNRCYYAVVGGTEWEVGIGTYTASGTTLARTEVLASSNSGSAVNFSAGTKDVFITHAGALGPAFPLKQPITGDFSWTNQNSAAIANTLHGGIHLSRAANSSAYSLNIRRKAAPSTPYTITAAFLRHDDPVPNGLTWAGLCFRQSSDGKLQAVGPAPSNAANAVYWLNSKFTDENNHSANYQLQDAKSILQSVYHLRIADDGTNRKCSLSCDGQNWLEIHSVGRTDFLTADQVGFFISAHSAPCGMTLLSWKEG